MTTDSKAVCGGGEDPFSVERIARLICEASGQNPDQCVHGSGVVTYGGDGKQAYAESKCYRRAWENHISPAKAVIARYAALASTAGAGAGDWLPIETAPKEFQPILLYLDRGKHGDIHRAPVVGVWNHAVDAWVHWNDVGWSTDAKPTHWMPLPAPPGQSPAVPASPRSGAGEGEEARLSKIIEAERSMVAIGLNAIRKAIAGRAWLSEAGRGSYAYDDDRYQREFGEALREIETACEPLRRVARDWSDCPKDRAEILTARAEFSPPAPSQGGGAGRSEKGEGDEEGRDFFGDLVVIWSERQGRYWKAPDDGTTKDLKRAAVHRRADAEKIAAGCPWLRLIPIAEAATPAPAQSPSTSDAEG